MATCQICQDLQTSEDGTDPWLVARLETGYVRLAPTQYFRGATFFVARECVREVFDLPPATRQRHLAEMSEVAASVHRAFAPRKVNIESLGNGVPHLHWWITPRYDSDPRPTGPIWEDLEFLRLLWTNGGHPDADERASTKSSLLAALRAADVTIDERA